jgi:alanine-synthesizing transaminase
MSKHTAPIHVSSRVAGFSYAIRNIVSEARKVEAEGRKVRYLNIGDPGIFGFQPPEHLVDAVNRALRDGHSAYAPSAGIEQAREAIAEDYSRKGLPLSADRVVMSMGASEGIDLALSSLLDPGDEVLVPTPTYPLYTAILARLGARAEYYPTDPAHDWMPSVELIAEKITARTRAIVVIDPNNPTGAVYSPQVRRQILELAEKHGLVVLADEVYAELAYHGAVPPLGSLAPDAAVLSFNSLSKGYVAPGWRTGWIAVGRTPRLDALLGAIKRLADGRLCSTGPMQYAVAPALKGARDHQRTFTMEIARRATLVTDRLNAVEGIRVVRPGAAFYVMPRIALPKGMTDEKFVLGLLRETGVLCVHGSGFGARPEEGYFRMVTLAPPSELEEVCDLIAQYTHQILGRHPHTPSAKKKDAPADPKKLILGD